MELGCISRNEILNHGSYIREEKKASIDTDGMCASYDIKKKAEYNLQFATKRSITHISIVNTGKICCEHNSKLGKL